MKVKSLSLLAGAASMLLAGGANADFLGISAEHHGTYLGTHDVYRLYANFSGGGLVAFWGGDGGQEAFSITSDLLEVGDQLGGGFRMTAFQPSVLVQSAGALYDAFADDFNNSTFMTVGVGAGYIPFGQPGAEVGEVFQLTPGFNPSVLGQTQWGGTGGVVSNPGAPNGFADANGRVLLGQFSVLMGTHVSGTNITLSGQTTGAGAGGFTPFEVGGLSFTTIPAPGALALLGLAGLAGARRRRA